MFFFGGVLILSMFFNPYYGVSDPFENETKTIFVSLGVSQPLFGVV